MRRLKTLILLGLILASGLYFREDVSRLYSRFADGLINIQKFAADLEEVRTEVSAPGPIRFFGGDPDVRLTMEGAVDSTNQHRQRAGLAPLMVNTKLSQAAEIKAQDMFSRQYFAHVAPDGADAGDLAQRVSYSFIAIGENLALGNYAGDEALVSAWMNSPGHRENILKPSFEEIGVGVIKDEFEGRTTWMAVQIFAKPSSSCPAPDQTLKVRIQENQQRIAELKQEIEVKEKEIEEAETREERNQKAEQYNALIREHNQLVEETKTLVSQYNQRVREFNACAKS